MKMTPVGLIPEDWNIIQLADYIVDINDGPFGSNLKSEHYTLDREVRIIQLGNVGDSGWNDENVKYTTFEHASTLKRCIVPYGTIIIAKMMPAGRAIICPSSEPAYIQGSDVVKVVFTDSIDKDFFIYLTKSKAYLEQIESGVQGSTRARTNIGKIKSLKLPLPSVEEQKRIAGALLSVDKMIVALDEAISKKRQIKEGLMQQLLTGKTRLPGFSGEWKREMLGKHATVLRGGSPRPIESFLTTDPDGINWIKIGDVGVGAKYIVKTEERIIPEGASRSRKVKAGDFLLSNSMSFGRPYILKIDGCIHDGWLVIQDYNDSFDTDYLYYALNASETIEQYKSMAAGSSVLNLNKDIVRRVLVSIPSIEEQRAMALVLSSADEEIVSLESKRDKYILVKQGMMQELLTGKTRLI